MMKERNMMIGYHGLQIHRLPPLSQSPKVTCKKLIENLLIRNNRDKIPPFFVD